jgi:hypothetical protein
MKRRKLTRNPLLVFAIFVAYMLTLGVLSQDDSVFAKKVNVALMSASLAFSLIVLINFVVKWFRHDSTEGRLVGLPESIRRWMQDLPDDKDDGK